MVEIGDRSRSARTARGITQQDLAKRAGISRQALGAIESGLYYPSVTVALGLARELGETVETLFGTMDEQHRKRIDAAWSDPELAPCSGSSCKVALARVAGKIVAVPQLAARLQLSLAAGTVDRVERKHAIVSTYWSETEIDSTLLMAGCDPAVAILGDWLAPAVAGDHGRPALLE